MEFQIIWTSSYIFLIANIRSLALNSTKPQEFDVNKVYLGDIANPAGFRSVVNILEEETKLPYCSGTVLTWDLVLTTCHCAATLKIDEVFPLNTSADGRIVKGQPFGSKYSETRSVKFFFLHAECTRGQWIWLNDVAIAKLDSPFNRNGQVQPAHFWSHNYWRTALKYENWFLQRRTCAIGGTGLDWHLLIGNLEYKPKMNVSRYFLRAVEQVVSNMDPCLDVICQKDWKNMCDKYRWRDLPFDGFLCGFRKGIPSGGPCWGDSGAPLICFEDEPPLKNEVVNAKEPLYGYAVAILSATFYCGQQFGGPFFYMSLRKYWGFISVFASRFRGAPEFYKSSDAVRCDEGAEVKVCPEKESLKSVASQNCLTSLFLAIHCIIYIQAHCDAFSTLSQLQRF